MSDICKLNAITYYGHIILWSDQKIWRLRVLIIEAQRNQVKINHSVRHDFLKVPQNSQELHMAA